MNPLSWFMIQIYYLKIITTLNTMIIQDIKYVVPMLTNTDNCFILFCLPCSVKYISDYNYVFAQTKSIRAKVHNI